MTDPSPDKVGDGADLDLYDDNVQAGISWTLRQVGEALGLTTWTQGDGSESVEGDVGIMPQLGEPFSAVIDRVSRAANRPGLNYIANDDGVIVWASDLRAILSTLQSARGE